MERIASGSRVVTLSALLSEPVEHAGPTLDLVPAPDPQEVLERERQRVLEAAREEGYAHGLKQAEEEIRAAMERTEQRVQQSHTAEGERLKLANQQVENLLRSIPQSISDADDRVEELAIEVAFAAVLRVLGQAAVDGDLIKALSRQALAEYRLRPVTLRVAAEDIRAITDLAIGEDVRVVADPCLVSGKCRLETHKGIYDTSIEVRLDALKQAFLNALGTGGHRA